MKSTSLLGLLCSFSSFIHAESSSSSAPNYRTELVSLHKSLVDIESISGNEYGPAKFLEEYLRKKGYSVSLQEIPPADDEQNPKKRYNVLAWPDAKEGTRSPILVSSHIDTVPPYYPYSISDDADHLSKDTVIRGRGSVDDKASVASQIMAVEELKRKGELEPGKVVLLFVVGEEVNGIGMRSFANYTHKLDPSWDFDAGIFGEPTENKLACGHKGILKCKIEVEGKAAHSGYPWLGKSANELLIRALGAIMKEDLGSSERYGNTTFNVGLMQGGVAANVVSPSASAEVSIRIAMDPTESGHLVVRSKVERILKETDPEAFSMTCVRGYGAVPCNCDVEGFDTISVNYGTDVPYMAGDFPHYLYGPGAILVAHSDHESLTLGSLEQSVEHYQVLIKHAMKSSSRSEDGGGSTDL